MTILNHSYSFDKWLSGFYTYGTQRPLILSYKKSISNSNFYIKFLLRRQKFQLLMSS